MYNKLFNYAKLSLIFLNITLLIFLLTTLGPFSANQGQYQDF